MDNDWQGIDFHVHLPAPQVRDPDIEAAKKKYFKAGHPELSADEMADMYRQLRLKAVVFTVDAETARGMPGAGNDFVAEVADRNRDILVAFATVDPWKGRTAEAELRRGLSVLGLKGLKLHPSFQGFYPNERRFYALYEICCEFKVPVIFHTGHTGIGATLPGGKGIKLKYSRPIPYLDDVAADFPELTIIGAHPSWPWQDEMLSMALHKGNVFIDLSGWSPRYFSPSLIQYANTLLQDKCLFGTDYPLITPQRWLEDFAKAPFRDEVRPKILYQNAARILGLADTATDAAK